MVGGTLRGCLVQFLMELVQKELIGICHIPPHDDRDGGDEKFANRVLPVEIKSISKLGAGREVVFISGVA
jgi:hypothetical protein